MESVAFRLNIIIEKHLTSLQAISQEEFSLKTSPLKWSKKEILGHLVDSAQTNIRRFIVAQYDERPIIVYNQDKWVTITDYQHYNLSDLINLWYLLNKHICHLLKTFTPEMAERKSEAE